MSRIVILDCKAVQALAAADHPHHKRAIAHIQVIADRKKRSRSTSALVPTAVRVEANLNRTKPQAALFNSLRIRDASLDGTSADEAADIHERCGVSVADAHVGAAISAVGTSNEITVLTSDPKDIRLVAANKAITTVKL